MGYTQPIKPRRGAGEKIGLFGCGGATRETFESIEQHRIAAGTLVDREVALEHAAAGAEILDAGVDIGRQALAISTDDGGRCAKWKSKALTIIANPPSFTYTFGQVDRALMSALQPGNTSSRL